MRYHTREGIPDVLTSGLIIRVLTVLLCWVGGRAMNYPACGVADFWWHGIFWGMGGFFPLLS